MAYGGESIAKKLARYKIWTDILEQPTFYRQWADLGRFLVLCGPDRGDVTFLDACLFAKSRLNQMITRHQPEELLVAVDHDIEALEKAIHLDEHNLYAPAIYKSAPVDQVAQEYRKEFSCIYLDFCANISDKTLDTAARTIVHGLRDGGVFAMSVMMGRELEDVYARITHPKRKLIGAMIDTTGLGRERPDLSEAAVQRVEFLYRELTDRLNNMCVGYLDMQGALSYVSAKYKKGEKRSVGVPMLTMWWGFRRAPKQMNRYQFGKWSYFNSPKESKVMMRTLGSGPECAQEIIDIVTRCRQAGMPTRLLERVLNIKFDIEPSGRIAVYDWHALACEEDEPQFDITKEGTEDEDGNDTSGTA